MKWLKTIVIFDNQNVVSDAAWAKIHSSYVRAIESIDHPVGSGSLTLRKKAKVANSKQWTRNGVSYLRTRFLDHIVNIEKWKAEAQVGITNLQNRADLTLYPSGEKYNEPISSNFGGFDFFTTVDGLRVAIEWETGNISSSHRSMNKLSIALDNDKIDVGVLILPSKDLYEHLTDRVGNIGELSPYLDYWNGTGAPRKGLLVISVVEHHHLNDNPTHPYLPAGKDGRAIKK